MHTEIDALIHSFFAWFDNRARGQASLDGSQDLFLPEVIIAKRGGGGRLEVMSLEAFMGPRREILSNGTLVDFHEWEEGSETVVFGGIASRISRYRKEGILNGKPYVGGGMKATHLLLTERGWRISAILWQDFDEDSPEQESHWLASGRKIRA
jgi:hypothetical protein